MNQQAITELTRFWFQQQLVIEQMKARLAKLKEENNVLFSNVR